MSPTTLAFEIRELRAQPYLGKRFHADVSRDVGSLVARGFEELFATLERCGVHPSGPPFLIGSQPIDGGMDIEVGVPCAQPPASGALRAGLLPAGRAAVTVHRGGYDKIAPTYAALSSWILTNGYVMAGAPREVYLTGPEVPEEGRLTELIWPIE